MQRPLPRGLSPEAPLQKPLPRGPPQRTSPEAQIEGYGAHGALEFRRQREPKTFKNIHQTFKNIHQTFKNIHQTFKNIHQTFTRHSSWVQAWVKAWRPSPRGLFAEASLQRPLPRGPSPEAPSPKASLTQALTQALTQDECFVNVWRMASYIRKLFVLG